MRDEGEGGAAEMVQTRWKYAKRGGRPKCVSDRKKSNLKVGASPKTYPKTWQNAYPKTYNTDNTSGIRTKKAKKRAILIKKHATRLATRRLEWRMSGGGALRSAHQ
jgi:hypothetical protein